jgi:hypothetical protein
MPVSFAGHGAATRRHDHYRLTAWTPTGMVCTAPPGSAGATAQRSLCGRLEFPGSFSATRRTTGRVAGDPRETDPGASGQAGRARSTAPGDVVFRDDQGCGARPYWPARASSRDRPRDRCSGGETGAVMMPTTGLSGGPVRSRRRGLGRGRRGGMAAVNPQPVLRCRRGRHWLRRTSR